MTIRKLRLAAATGLVVLMLGAGAGATFAASPGETGVEATESTTDPAAVGAVETGHADAPGVDVNWEFNGQE